MTQTLTLDTDGQAVLREAEAFLRATCDASGYQHSDGNARAGLLSLRLRELLGLPKLLRVAEDGPDYGHAPLEERLALAEARIHWYESVFEAIVDDGGASQDAAESARRAVGAEAPYAIRAKWDDFERALNYLVEVKDKKAIEGTTGVLELSAANAWVLAYKALGRQMPDPRPDRPRKITPKDLVGLLNELLALDARAITCLLMIRTFTQGIERHPFVITDVSDDPGFASVGLIGILNGLLQRNGWGRIAAWTAPGKGFFQGFEYLPEAEGQPLNTVDTPPLALDASAPVELAAAPAPDEPMNRTITVAGPVPRISDLLGAHWQPSHVATRVVDTMNAAIEAGEYEDIDGGVHMSGGERAALITQVMREVEGLYRGIDYAAARAGDRDHGEAPYTDGKVKCEPCGGNGKRAGVDPESCCPACKGSGQVPPTA